MPPFKIKICGVTSVDDAQAAVCAGADAIGLNFYPGSKRLVTTSVATSIVAAIPIGVVKVGVFVDPTLEELSAAQSACGARGASLDMIQLHGNEPAEFLREMRGLLPVIRAIRWTSADLVETYLTRCAKLDCLPQAVLIDSYSSHEFGGTGETADWQAIASWRRQSTFDLPLVTAGGLTAQNVAEAIATIRPDAVDTASGVESAPRRKDAQKMAAFVAAARSAFA